MVRATFRHSEVGDGLALAPRLRTADKKEMIAATGESSPSSLEKGIRDCDECWTMEIDDEPIAMYGYKDSGDGSAYIWLMGSDRINDVKWQFLRISKNAVRSIASKYDSLWSLSDVRNTKHREWYEWIGFHVIKEVPAGPYGLPFNLIEWKEEK